MVIKIKSRYYYFKKIDGNNGGRYFNTSTFNFGTAGAADLF